MYVVVSIYDDGSGDAYVMPEYDEEIINFLEEINSCYNGFGVIVVDGDIVSTGNMRISFFKNVEDIIDVYSYFLDDQKYAFNSLALHYKEICDHIYENYVTK